jgi:hypothetical protein
LNQAPPHSPSLSSVSIEVSTCGDNTRTNLQVGSPAFYFHPWVSWLFIPFLLCVLRQEEVIRPFQLLSNQFL